MNVYNVEVIIYHNPRCSKSRETLALLQKKCENVTIIEYLKTPPDKNTLESILKKLNITAKKLLRKKENIYSELNLGKELENSNVLIDAMIKNPILIERPIVITNNKAAIGRPPETVLNILK